MFTASGDLVGISSLPDERDEPRRGAARVVRIDGACELVAAAAKKVKDAPAPSGTHLPVEPAEPAPIAAFKDAVKRRAGSLLPYQMAASEFDVAFITPVLNFAAQSQPNQNFSNWSDYVADIPPVLFVRVTPKMAESFWAKVARGAAYDAGDGPATAQAAEVRLPAASGLSAAALRSRPSIPSSSNCASPRRTRSTKACTCSIRQHWGQDAAR